MRFRSVLRRHHTVAETLETLAKHYGSARSKTYEIPWCFASPPWRGQKHWKHLQNTMVPHGAKHLRFRGVLRRHHWVNRKH